MNARWLFVALSAACCACAGKTASSDSQPTLTERQQDSILARSSIPGAPAVGKAMRLADSTSAQINSTDSVSQ